MTQSKNIYLGKAGKIFGPYSSEEYDKLAVSGEITQYTWLWSASEKKWSPLEAPPPSPVSTPTLAASPTPQAQSGWSKIQAVCYDLSQLISGNLEAVTQTGCMLVSASDDEVPTVFLGNKTFLNLLDESSGRSHTVPVQLFKQAYQDGKCLYWLRWNEIPEVLG